MYYANRISKTTTWIRPVILQAPPSPSPPFVQHVAEREQKRAHNCVRFLGTAGMIGTPRRFLAHFLRFGRCLCVRASRFLRIHPRACAKTTLEGAKHEREQSTRNNRPLLPPRFVFPGVPVLCY